MVVILDMSRTPFFPEAAGQSSAIGGGGGVGVNDARKRRTNWKMTKK